jgi:NADH dehydrogenase
MQMGDHVAKMIESDLNHQPRHPFRYFDKGDMATIGRMAAVAKVEWPFHARWSGFLAWVTWLTVHIYFLIGFRNRLAVLAQWIWSYFTFSSGVRIIYGSQDLPGWTSHDGVEEPLKAPPPDPTTPNGHAGPAPTSAERPSAAD